MRNFPLKTARDRTRDPDVLATRPRLDWARLLRRTFACEVLVCPQCTGRARVLAAIHDPIEARRLLDARDQRSVAQPLWAVSRDDEDDETPHVREDDVEDDALTYVLTLEDHEPPPPSERAPPSSRPEAPPPDD